MSLKLRKPLLWVALAVPPMGLAVLVFTNRLGANPIEAAIEWLGLYTLWALLMTLAISSVHRRLGWAGLVPYRRTIGVAAFAYGFLHLLVYAVLDQGLHWPTLWGDIVKRPFISAGLIALLIMAALAVTSTNGWVKRLKRGWKRMHRWVYLALLLGVFHGWMMVKTPLSDLPVETLVGVLLLGERLWLWREKQKIRQKAG